jgi:eukaryotic-like serine/threonine-protein kinase
VIAIEGIQNPPLQQDRFDSTASSRSQLSADLHSSSSSQTATRTLASGWKSTTWNERAFVRGEVLAGIYEIGDLLGQGGMGQVFAAVDRKHGRDVAIKTTWSRKDSDTLRNEARVLSKLQHPGIVKFYGLESHDEAAFMVMERLRGSNLQSEMALWSSAGAHSTGCVIDCLIGVCDALETIHASGYAHRDLKPQNIVLVDAGRPVLIDFGLAIHKDEVDSDLRMAGSPHYIAPETIQARVTRGEEHLIDIYALGVLAFEIITGRPPFRHCVLRKILDMHLNAKAPRLSQCAASVPAALEQLVASMMDKRPQLRPQSAGEVAARLRAIRCN